jgi:transcriptional regulator of acetoin/glycerol metabolism
MTTRATRKAPEELDQSGRSDAKASGLVAVFCRRPVCVAFRSGARVGRDALSELGLDDDLVSREHFVVDDDGGLGIVDLGSRNGTFVDGVVVTAPTPIAPGAVVRAGKTLFVATDDCGRFERSPTRTEDGEVRGPTTAHLLARATGLGRLDQLLVTGESGVGKELVAKAFHGTAGKRPFVAVNCATISSGIAERLLFGARRGAFTSAEQDADGFIRAAQGGTLFLDEVAELDLAVQAKLLRFLETREYFPVGETRASSADVKVCCATLRDLGDEVAARRFREDLFHRIAAPTLEIPPLAARKEEVPFLIDLVARRFKPRVDFGLGFVERAMLAAWPGNVRQLLRTVEAAFVLAEVDGCDRVNPDALPEPSGPTGRTNAPIPLAVEPSEEEVRHAMEVSGGNVSMAARALGVHRSKLRRTLGKLD